MGEALAAEARNKGAHCMLGPTVCIHRHPLGGRNFESFSEDPYLTGKLSSQVIQGLQSMGISATIKHFVANEQETQRTTVDETISERALREIYLRPFEIAVKEANSWAIMTAYNLVNGTHCDSHSWLLQDVLRGKDNWAWSGLIMSDWGGTNSISNALNAGLDLEMPGPPRIRKLDKVLDAVKQGTISEITIDDRAGEVLRWVLKLKKLEEAVDLGAFAGSGDKPEHRALIRDAGAKGMVLLKNESNILPLQKRSVQGKRIALIGFAKDAMAHGGGSASVNAYYKVTPWEGMQAALGDSVEFTYAKGAHRERLLPPIKKEDTCGSVVGLDGQPGFTRLLYEDGQSNPCSSLHGHPTSAYSPLGSNETFWKSLVIVGDFTPVETGTHYISCSGLGPTTLAVNDGVVFEQKGNCDDPMGSLFLAAPEEEIKYDFVAGKTYRISIRSNPPVNIGLEILEGRSGVRVGFSLGSVHDADLQNEAVRVAQDADIAIVFTGHDPQWETEGRDQDSFNLPRNQNELVSAVAATNKNTIVVNSTGVAISMPWLDQVKGVVQAWFSGQECGNAIADVLTGATNPEGRLPVTFPKHIEDSPAHGNFPGGYVNGQLKVNYAEGVFVGYRHFDRVDPEKINFPFGFGLSYTDFEYSPMKISQDAVIPDSYTVDVHVSNTGHVFGGTLIQIYVGTSTARPEHPVKTLAAFAKTRLNPKEAQTVQLRVNARDFAYFDEEKSKWVVDEGEYSFTLGSSSAVAIQVQSVYIKAVTYAP
ncbi:glycoside hydrolase family 3 protein [Lophiostoma macrostomum CBS 122681]|uniref:beta-glucosidase n=1 Tax=Lophiostoma macrostomum CBS 122681 TaxID=1314788 RepID=A0A6A6TGZ1_9PLEO|nr:glycoside hydrolase family 3 protein [Lophiostoma macrostomum CBS 122681]